MATLGDSLTIGIVLTLVFGAVCFYLYSRMSQNEKRVGLLESLLLNIKLSTEATLMGPDMVEPTSSPAPLESSDVEEVDEENYADMLKEIPSVEVDEEKEAADLLRSMNAPVRKMDANYESMSLKELQALARQRGLTSAPNRKRELIDALKKQNNAEPPVTHQPLSTEGQLEGAIAGESGFKVDLE